jgi:hypothetical protein
MRSRTLTLGLVALLGSAPSAAWADPVAGVTYDEAFAWFSVRNSGSMSNSVPSHTWGLEAVVRAVGPGIPKGSAFTLVIKQGARELARATTPGTVAWELVRDHPSNPADAFSASFSRVGNLSATGAISVEVYFVNDSDDSETLLHTHEIEVRRATRLRNDRKEGPAEFFINRHGESPVMIIQRVPGRTRSYLSGYRGRGQGFSPKNAVYLSASRSYAAANNLGADMRLRCTVNGERVELENDAVTGRPDRVETASEVRPRGNQLETDAIQFERFTLGLPLTFGTDDEVWAAHTRLEDHPGQWACSIRNAARNALREFSFVVSADGNIAPHPEEAHVTLIPGAHFVQTTIPATDNPLDVRTDPASRTFFYGRSWSSAEGRQMAGAVPAIGSAFPPTARVAARRK